MDSSRAGHLPDRWLFYFLYPLLALVVVHVGNDNSFSHLLTLPSYYTDLLLAFAIAYSLGLYFHWLYRKLTPFPAIKPDFLFFVRVFVAGLLVPVTFAILMEIIYLRQIGIPLADSSVFYLELPLVVMSCVVINLIYILLILSRYRSQGNNISGPRDSGNAVQVSEHACKSGFNAYIGNKMVRVNDGEVAYFMIRDRMNFLVTTEGKRYFYDDSLENISRQVNPSAYFQLNRQFLARRQSILSATQTKTRRLDIQLTPDPEQPVFVAKNKASLFLSWLNNE